ncbi:MAG: hypothetical protein H8E66_32250 [Planctomycetes bacterium]|nr:hypothetical protein [Planctomycetota bacterium]
MESLDARVVLASDSFVGPLPEPIAAIVESQIAAATAEAEATPMVAFNYDVNRDGQIAPIDGLLVVNAVIDVAAGVPVAEGRFAATDVNSDGELTDADVALMIEHIEATLVAASGASAQPLGESEGVVPCEENPACDPPTPTPPTPTPPTPPTPTPTTPTPTPTTPTPTPTTPTPTPTTPTPTPTTPTPTPTTPTPTPTTPTPTPTTPTPTPTTPTPTPTCSTPVAVDDGPFMAGMMSGGDLMSNDTAAGSMIVVSLPAHGKLFGGSGELGVGDTFSTWSYTPTNDSADEGWHGTDTWSYKVQEACMDGSTQDSNSATVTVNVPEVDMVIYHGQGGAAVDKTKEQVKNKLDANGDVELDAHDNKIKVGEGAFTVANQNDTDNDEKVDSTDDDFALTGGIKFDDDGRDEIDLIRIVLKKPSIYKDGDTVMFNASGPGGSDSVRIWKEKVRTHRIDDFESFSFGASEAQREYWVELVNPSVEIGDYNFSYAYMEGGMTDYANATAVWSTRTDSMHDLSTAAEVFAHFPDLETETKHNGVKVGVNKWDGAGVKGSSFVNLVSGLWQLFPNVIVSQFTVSPPRIGEYSHIVTFDLARRVESVGWITVPGAAPVKDPPSKLKVFPKNPEEANDDGSEGDESTGPDDKGHMYVHDGPAPIFKSPEYADTLPVGTIRFRVSNYEDYIRVGIGTDPSGNGVSGSQASDKFLWHTYHEIDIKLAFGFRVLARSTVGEVAGQNEVAPGRIEPLPDAPP